MTGATVGAGGSVILWRECDAWEVWDCPIDDKPRSLASSNNYDECVRLI